MLLAGVRAEQKRTTRNRVLAAARDLFTEQGYEATTVRMIAQRAGVASGSVFTTFARKVDILHEVMLARVERLYTEIENIVPHLRGTVPDRLGAIAAVHYAFEMNHPRLFTAYMAANFDWGEGPAVVSYGQNDRLIGFLRDILEGGIARGEVRPDADIDVFIEVMLSAYGFSYRLAAQQGLTTDDLISRMDRQIEVLFRGVAAKK